jgi:hypothetical protein
MKSMQSLLDSPLFKIQGLSLGVFCAVAENKRPSNYIHHQ